MNREIKFRCWDIQLNKFTYFDIFTAWGNIPSDSKENIQQFTGTKDRKNKEIYEGDIVRHIFGIEKINYYNGTFITNDLLLYENYKSFEVIGNIFENPKLLKNA